MNVSPINMCNAQHILTECLSATTVAHCAARRQHPKIITPFSAEEKQTPLKQIGHHLLFFFFLVAGDGLNNGCLLARHTVATHYRVFNRSLKISVFHMRRHRIIVAFMHFSFMCSNSA